MTRDSAYVLPPPGEPPLWAPQGSLLFSLVLLGAGPHHDMVWLCWHVPRNKGAGEDSLQLLLQISGLQVPGRNLITATISISGHFPHMTRQFWQDDALHTCLSSREERALVMSDPSLPKWRDLSLLLGTWHRLLGSAPAPLAGFCLLSWRWEMWTWPGDTLATPCASPEPLEAFTPFCFYQGRWPSAVLRPVLVHTAC